MRSHLLIRALPVFALLGGCGTAPGRLSWDADTAAIRQLYRDWPRTIESGGDAARYVTFLDDSVTLLIPGADAVHGVPAYREVLTPLLQNATYRVALQPPTQLQVTRPWAFALYRAELVTFPRPRADSSVARNRYVDILRHQSDGSWRVYLHSWQPDVAPTR